MRAIVEKGPQRKNNCALQQCQLLLGINDTFAAKKLGLAHEAWDTQDQNSVNEFLTWIKRKVRAGAAVIIGVYTNEYLFYGDTNPDAGNEEYDHIVLVESVQSANPDGGYDANDVLTFSDHGLWAPSSPPQYFFSYTFGKIQKNRHSANAQDGPVYSLCNDPDVGNYGIAITSLVDAPSFPVQIETRRNYERPEIADGSNQQPAPMTEDVTVTVKGLTAGKSYTLEKFDEQHKEPVKTWNFKASSSTHRSTDSFPSNRNIRYTAHEQ